MLGVGTAVCLTAFVALAVAYAVVRGVPLAVAPPSRADLPTVAVANAAPVGLVAATDLLAGLAGSPTATCSGRRTAPEPGSRGLR